MSLWAIVPLKIITSSKQRLSGVLSSQQRIQLTLAMAQDVLTTLQACNEIDHLLLVSGDQVAEQLCEVSGAEWLKPKKQEGLNNDLEFACHYAHLQAANHCLILHADLPLLHSNQIDQLIREARDLINDSKEPSIAIVPCKQGTGSNLLYAPLPFPLPLVYGQGSFQRFQEEAAKQRIKCHSLALKNGDLDVDIPADLNALRRRINVADQSSAKATRLALAEMDQTQTD